MELNVIKSGNHPTKSINVSSEKFDCNFNETLVHQVVTAYMAGARAGTKAQKNRSAVSGGGAKPWRQKGTGRARAGTIRSPLWRKGGKIFAASPRDYTQKVNRKMYKVAMRSIISELIRQDRLIVVEEFMVSAPKTKELVAKLKDFNLESALVVSDNIDKNLLLAARNLYKIQLCEVDKVSPVNLIAFEKVVMTVNALKQLEERLG